MTGARKELRRVKEWDSRLQMEDEEEPQHVRILPI
jgi:hypothetical protein